MKHFNTTGIYYPNIHHMADTSSVIASINGLSEYISDFCLGCEKPVVLMM